eukprot:INCI4569.1.p1 GENE.INCI4569.1~~INCI4569.1.p1  ORF type:complete len:237 (-),score=24.19 INCI4569.1:47-757(-)
MSRLVGVAAVLLTVSGLANASQQPGHQHPVAGMGDNRIRPASSSSSCIGTSENLTESDCAAVQAWVDDEAFTETLTSICPHVRSDPCNCTFDRPVQCSAEGRVTQLRLGKQGLQSDHFPESLLNLTGMVWFDMAANSLGGTIPESISKLSKLGFLALGTNRFSGTIPQALALALPGLTDLGIDTNPRLTGTLPALDFNRLTSCCAVYGVPFECPLPPGAENCSHCNYHPVPPPACT